MEIPRDISAIVKEEARKDASCWLTISLRKEISPQSTRRIAGNLIIHMFEDKGYGCLPQSLDILIDIYLAELTKEIKYGLAKLTEKIQ